MANAREQYDDPRAFPLFWLPLLGLCLLPAAALATPPGTLVLKRPYRVSQAKPSAKAFSCARAVAQAIRHNPDFLAARARLQIAAQELQAAKIFPTNPDFSIIGKGKHQADPVKPKTAPYKLENELIWKMPIGGRWGARERWARRSLQHITRQIRVIRMQLTFRTQKACYDLLIARQKATLYVSLVAFYKRVTDLIQRRKQTGAATILDFNLARMELLRNQAALKLAQAAVLNKLQKMAALMGWRKPQMPLISDRFSSLPALPALALLRKRTEQHPLLRTLQARIQEYQALLSFARAKAIPDLKFKLFYALQEENNHIIGGGLALPLPLFQRNQSKIWTTQAKIRQTRLKIKAVRFKLQQRLLQMRTQYQAQRSVVSLYQNQLLPVSQKQIQLHERGLKLGKFSILKVISAQQSQNKALLQYIDALKQALHSLIALQQALGAPLPVPTVQAKPSS